MVAGAGGFEVGFHGEYREIVPDERIVTTEIFEGVPAHGMPASDASVNVVTFDETDGRTTLRLLVQAPSKELRDTIVASGMEAGIQEGLDLLEQIAIELA